VKLLRRFAKGIIAFSLFTSLACTAFAQSVAPDLSSLQWRGIGPYRGGRTVAAAGDPTQPNVFYIGVCNGGVWRTTDYGRTWQPLFDQQPTGSIGSIAVAPSNPKIIYVGSGEGLHRPDLSVGDGIYKSTDGGATWTHLGLRDGQQIPGVAVDPHNPDRLFVAVAGHPYGPNPERGVFRSTDGGQTFTKVLYKDENTGGGDVLIDPVDPRTVYATLWEAREGPWENGEWKANEGGIYKSTDGGDTFQPLTGGLPTDIVQAHIALAPSDPKVLYATVATTHDLTAVVTIYRSDDAGANWRKITDDIRPAIRIGGGDLPVPKVDPKNPDVVYSTSISTWRSRDGGKTWTGIRGAPGGDDYQGIWINPNDPNIILLTSDQGAIISVNGGATWSSWYNQPTAQLYHVSADNAFPYRVCSGQQESGSVCIRTRSDDGEITIRDWHPVAAEEYGFVTPDPLDPDTVFGGKLTRYNRRTDQAQNILPKPLRGPEFRMVRTEPIVFSPVDPHVLYFAANTLWKTTDGGRSWQQISPDLTRKTWAVPATVGIYSAEKSAQPTQRGVIYAIAPSPLDVNRIWAGTDDGTIHLTTDGGKTWTDVTPSQLIPWAKVCVIEASHSDPNTAYAAINTLRLDDLRPHILRTRDGGKTWTEIVTGIPNDENVNAVREDPQHKGLLFAGTERAVYFSLDDGDHWQSLRLNMPASSVRDVTIKDADLIAATHGRGFWVLDDITPLRQIQPQVMAADAFLFKPETALRVRWNMNTDTPFPPDVPAGKNPPDGAIIDYYLKSAANGPVTLEIRDSAGKVVRRYSSTDKVEAPKPAELRIPAYWVRMPQTLAATPGMHRSLWDMHYPRIPFVEADYPIAAIPHETAPDFTSPWVMPGLYTIALTVNGKTYTQPLTVKMDPRVKTPIAGLRQQFDLSMQLYNDAIPVAKAAEQATKLQGQLKTVQAKAGDSAVAPAIKTFTDELNSVAGGGQGRSRRAAAVTETLTEARSALVNLMATLQEVDDPPTTQAVAAIAEVHQKVPALLQRWQAVQHDLPAFNAKLRAAGLPEVQLTAETSQP
jgi:photosystem II stability/assembly factor-like uncharacterized protein